MAHQPLDEGHTPFQPVFPSLPIIEIGPPPVPNMRRTQFENRIPGREA